MPSKNGEEIQNMGIDQTNFLIKDAGKIAPKKLTFPEMAKSVDLD